MDDGGGNASRQYQVRPRRILPILLSIGLFAVVGTAVLVLFSPVRKIIPGVDAHNVTHEARLNALRLEALEDSLSTQEMYVAQLRKLLTGDIEGAFSPAESAQHDTPSSDFSVYASEPSANWADHEQPALPLIRIPAGTRESASDLFSTVPTGYLSTLRFPVEPPVNGFMTRGFDARRGHFGVDIAIEEGTVVRAIGDGYVVFSDWTHDGGYVISLQHAGGFVSTYKHNSRLLKQAGDRVRDREAIALSGNTGEITSGPHVHFEIWHDGLAQDPRQFFVGW